MIDGPFAETKELVAGFWLLQVKSKEEAIEWVKRCPNPMPGEAEIEIRQVFETEDFGERAHARASRAGGPPARADRASAERRRGHASRTVPVLRRPLRGGARVLPQRARRRGDDAHALQGQPGAAPARHGPARLREQGDALELPHRRHDGDGVRRPRARGKPSFQGISLSITAPSDAEAERLFAALADGGQVRMPLTKTFFSSRFGMVTDRFGVSWMVIVAPS